MSYLHDWCVIKLSRGVTVWKSENAYERKMPLALISPKLLIGMDSKQCLMEPETCFKSIDSLNKCPSVQLNKIQSN